MSFRSDFYIDKCVAWILNGGYSKVAIQMPDNLLKSAYLISKTLEEEVGFQIYILGDTTFGSCCVDEVACEHIGADALIHFGRSCLSSSQRLPVLHVLGPHIPVNVDKVAQVIREKGPPLDENVILTCDYLCFYMLESLYEMLKSYTNILITSISGSKSTYIACSGLHSKHSLGNQHCFTNDCNNDSLSTGKCTCCNNVVCFGARKVKLPEGANIKNFSFIYIGESNQSFTTLRLRFPGQTFYRISPCGSELQCSNSLKEIMSRSSKMKQVEDASIVGILIGTLGVANYKIVIKNLKNLIKASNKKSYTFVIGKPNEPKLANFDLVDVFVHVACPESTLFERQSDPYLYRKIVSPWEVYVTLKGITEWTHEYKLDFRDFLGDELLPTENVEKNGKENSTVLSQELVSKSSSELTENRSGALAPVHEGGAGAMFSSLSWQGLERSVVGPKPGTVVEGRKGIASGYDSEIK